MVDMIFDKERNRQRKLRAEVTVAFAAAVLVTLVALLWADVSGAPYWWTSIVPTGCVLILAFIVMMRADAHEMRPTIF